MTFEEEFEVIKNNLLESLDKDLKREIIPGMLDSPDRTFKEATIEYNEKLKELKKKYNVD